MRHGMIAMAVFALVGIACLNFSSQASHSALKDVQVKAGLYSNGAFNQLPEATAASPAPAAPAAPAAAPVAPAAPVPAVPAVGAEPASKPVVLNPQINSVNDLTGGNGVKVSAASSNPMAPDENMADGNECCDDEEKFEKLCYKKCSILTNGQFDTRDAQPDELWRFARARWRDPEKALAMYAEHKRWRKAQGDPELLKRIYSKIPFGFVAAGKVEAVDGTKVMLVQGGDVCVAQAECLFVVTMQDSDKEVRLRAATSLTKLGGRYSQQIAEALAMALEGGMSCRGGRGCGELFVLDILCDNSDAMPRPITGNAGGSSWMFELTKEVERLQQQIEGLGHNSQALQDLVMQAEGLSVLQLDEPHKEVRIPSTSTSRAIRSSLLNGEPRWSSEVGRSGQETWSTRMGSMG
eukprot:g24195.t1